MPPPRRSAPSSGGCRSTRSSRRSSRTHGSGTRRIHAATTIASDRRLRRTLEPSNPRTLEPSNPRTLEPLSSGPDGVPFERVNAFFRLLRYARPYRGRLVLALVAMVIYGAASYGLVRMVAPILDAALPR